MNQKLNIVGVLNRMGIDTVELFNAWKLSPGSGWENVAEHCVVQAATHMVFSSILVSDDYAADLAKMALCHDVKKRADKRPGDFTAYDLTSANTLLDKIDANWKMINEILTPKFLVKFVTEGATLKERLLFIVDNMARDGDIVPFDDRIDEVSARNPDPEPQIRKLLGRPYWDVEREIGHIILTGFGVELRRQGYKVTTVADVAKFINDLLNKAFVR